MFSTSKVKDQFAASFHRFCDGTGLHGFIELYYAKAAFWTVTWTVIVIGAMVVTVFLLRNAVEQYIQSGSITEIIPLDSTLLYPPLSICYTHWIYWVDWEKAAALKMTKETVLFSMSFMTEVFSPTVFNVSETKENLTKIMNDNEIVSLTALYKNISRNFPMIIGTNGEIPYLLNDPLFFKTKKIMYKDGSLLLCYIVSGEEILKILQEQKKNQSNTRSSASVFNFSMLDPNYSFYKKYIQYDEYNYNMAFWLCKNTNYWVITLKDFSQNYTGYTLPIKLFINAYDSFFSYIETDSDFYTFTMTPTVHRWKSTRQKPCLVGQATISSDEECEEKCLAERDTKGYTCMELDQAALLGLDKIENLCRTQINFLPFKREKANVLDRPCDMFDPRDVANGSLDTDREIYSNGRSQKEDMETLDSLLDECKKNCAEPCEQWKYISSMSSFTISSAVKKITYKNQTDIAIQYPEDTDVLVVVEIDAQTWEDFVGNIGGLLGVWTGASLISIFQVFYLCCCSENSCTCCDRFRYAKPKRRKIIRPFVTAQSIKVKPRVSMDQVHKSPL